MRPVFYRTSRLDDQCPPMAVPLYGEIHGVNVLGGVPVLKLYWCSPDEEYYGASVRCGTPATVMPCEKFVPEDPMRLVPESREWERLKRIAKNYGLVIPKRLSRASWHDRRKAARCAQGSKEAFKLLFRDVKQFEQRYLR